MPDAFYVPTSVGRDGDRGDDRVDRVDRTEWSVEHVETTIHTQGPWDPGAQHGGPPAALLTRALEQSFGAATPGRLARIGVDILGPMPLDSIVVRRRVVRPGRAVALAEAELSSAGRTVAVARGWWIRNTDIGTALDPAAGPGLESPSKAVGSDRNARASGNPIRPRTGESELAERLAPRSADDDPVTGWPGGFLAAMRWRFAGGSFDTLGAAAAWARPRYPLVAGEPWSPAQKCAVLADCGNGLSGRLDPSKYYFINPELTLHLHRLPRGEWVGIRAQSSIERDGVGLASSVLFDDDGPIGRGEQALLVTPR